MPFVTRPGAHVHYTGHALVAEDRELVRRLVARVEATIARGSKAA